MTKERAALDLWLKEVAPSHALRLWFGHLPERWEEFLSRYRKEIESSAALDQLQAMGRRQKVSLLYAAKDPLHNTATALLHILAKRRD